MAKKNPFKVAPPVAEAAPAPKKGRKAAAPPQMPSGQRQMGPMMKVNDAIKKMK